MALVEPESFYVPHLLARLAARGLLSRIVVLRPRLGPSARARAARRAHAVVGWRGAIAVAGASIRARLADRLPGGGFYSVARVSRTFDVPLVTVSALDARSAGAAVRCAGDEVVLAQVSRRIPTELLAAAEFWNKHCSPLPAYAGVWPVFWAMLHGQPTLGVTIHRMDAEFDGGPILAQRRISSRGHTLFGAYHALHDAAGDLLIALLESGPAPGAAQEGQRTYFSFPTPADGAAFRRLHEVGTPWRRHPPIRRR